MTLTELRDLAEITRAALSPEELQRRYRRKPFNYCTTHEEIAGRIAYYACEEVTADTHNNVNGVMDDFNILIASALAYVNNKE